ncbi:MAG: homoserine O-acetyltransferase [Balneolaceae bacterium]|nr:homoserine O-acetyltransferase [Balneolaceae bacterium]MBO6544995.1 homoserine O-acetyltransferase [Balneolaceae bacterium]MBO6646391.1 homoserine O-acetyltransferase [Balneolaceae bacterium]
MSKIKKHSFSKSFTTESGFTFEKPEAAYHTWGTLNETKDNVILVIHALTGNSNIEDWFSGFFAESSPIDLKKHFVICMNIPGSCYGSLNPWSINPKIGEPYRGDFPVFTIRDVVRFQQLLINQLEIKGIELVLGGSYGGMIALEFVLMDERVKRACLVAMGKSHSPWAIGISHAQRMALYADPKWNNGFYEKNDPPAKGLAAARAMAMITYRTPQNYSEKFGRDYNPEKELFEVESYLEYQGKKLVSRFDALTYDRLTKSMDTHDVSRNRNSFKEVLGNIDIPVLVIGIDSDRLYPTSEQKELAELIPNAIYQEIHSPFGHDAFLIEFEQINKHLNDFLKEISSDIIF